MKDSPFYLQTIVEEKDKNSNSDAATLKTERMEDDKAKDLIDRVWGGFSKYKEEYIESLKKKGGDESYRGAARCTKKRS